VTINENADPSVKHDIVLGLDEFVPHLAGFKHAEGNSPAHIKSSLVGCSEQVLVEDGRLVLGTWQGIFLCEFDGPRRRRVIVRVFSD
ncbi:MAG TPA: YjbQ family protein, partial [Proteobacteria bacterium]|nr:YjbQ family protein [Pseudomonadota bacterium]